MQGCQLNPGDPILTRRHLYNLCQMFPESASDAIRFVLRDAMHEMEGMVEAHGRAAFPGLDVVSSLGGRGGPLCPHVRMSRRVVLCPKPSHGRHYFLQLVYLKVAGTLFPTSDFRHPVVTPALVCMSQLLTKVRTPQGGGGVAWS